MIRFDHRDTGRSTTIPPGEATYAVEDLGEDLGEDVVAILDAYGVGKANLVACRLADISRKFWRSAVLNVWRR